MRERHYELGESRSRTPAADWPADALVPNRSADRRLTVRNPGAGGIVAVTSRPAVRVRVIESSATLGLPQPVFVDELLEALELGIDRAVLFLDLGSCCKAPDLLSLVQAWVAFRPGSEVVAFTPLLEREEELKAVVALVREVRLGEVRVLTASDFFRDEVWRNLRDMRTRAALEAELRSDLLAAVNATGRPLLAAAVVLQILVETPRQADSQTSIQISDERQRMQADRERKAKWKRLHGSGQLPASWLIAIFRVLWHAKLHNAGWNASEIASFLGFISPRHFRLAVARRFGIRVRDLKQLSYGDVLDWAAHLLTPSPRDREARSVRSLRLPLIKCIDRATNTAAIQSAHPSAAGIPDEVHP